MAIDRSGKWWTGSSPSDLKEYIVLFGGESEHKVAEFRPARCECGGDLFELHFDNTEGAAKRICAGCRSDHLICDSADALPDADLSKWECKTCKGSTCNTGVGFAMSDPESVRWLYVGCRCGSCGLLGCVADWKIDYEPSIQLLSQV